MGCMFELLLALALLEELLEAAIDPHERIVLAPVSYTHLTLPTILLV